MTITSLPIVFSLFGLFGGFVAGYVLSLDAMNAKEERRKANSFTPPQACPKQRNGFGAVIHFDVTSPERYGLVMAEDRNFTQVDYRIADDERHQVEIFTWDVKGLIRFLDDLAALQAKEVE